MEDFDIKQLHLSAFGSIPTVYATPFIKAACDSLVGHVPAYHIESRVYDESEVSKWLAIQGDSSLSPDPAFMIVVDDETWPGVAGTPFQAQTQWLIVDARERLWHLYECTMLRGPGIRAGTTQVGGADFDPRTGLYKPVVGSTWRIEEAGRLVRVALTFMMMLLDVDVNLSPCATKGHWNVVLPIGLSVDDIIARVLRRDQSA